MCTYSKEQLENNHIIDLKDGGMICNSFSGKCYRPNQNEYSVENEGFIINLIKLVIATSHSELLYCHYYTRKYQMMTSESLIFHRFIEWGSDG